MSQVPAYHSPHHQEQPLIHMPTAEYVKSEGCMMSSRGLSDLYTATSATEFQLTICFVCRWDTMGADNIMWLPTRCYECQCTADVPTRCCDFQCADEMLWVPTCQQDAMSADVPTRCCEHRQDERCQQIVLKGPVLRTACGLETGPNWTETDRTFSPGPCFWKSRTDQKTGPNEPVLTG